LLKYFNWKTRQKYYRIDPNENKQCTAHAYSDKRAYLPARKQTKKTKKHKNIIILSTN